MNAVCTLCPHACAIPEGKTGICRARGNVDGTVRDLNYGCVTSAALDPIEKKPLVRFHPGSMVLSVGSYGCNFRCGFCQNNGISMCGAQDVPYEQLTPEDLVESARNLLPRGNIGIAFTYNEPLIGFEFVRDTAALMHEAGMLNVVVTNGYINEEPLRELLPLIDAWNIDLKAFSDKFYKEIGGDLETVKRTIALCIPTSHVEVTTLVVPGKNDSDEEIGALATWLASIDPETPLHLTRFFPRYKMAEEEPTDVRILLRLVDIAQRHLQYVYAGNI